MLVTGVVEQEITEKKEATELEKVTEVLKHKVRRRPKWGKNKALTVPLSTPDSLMTGIVLNSDGKCLLKPWKILDSI